MAQLLEKRKFHIDLESLSSSFRIEFLKLSSWQLDVSSGF
jgi:hypothetical protein